MRKILIILKNLLFLFISPSSKKNVLMNDEDLINTILSQQKSIIRFGDGEFRIMYDKKSIYYQEFSQSLCDELLNIVNNYSPKSKYILCLPPFIFENSLWFLKNESKYFFCFSKPRYLWNKHFNKKIKYGNAFLFGKNNNCDFSKIWKKSNNIIFVHNDVKWFNYFNKMYSKNAVFVKTSKKNSYFDIDKIISRIEKIDSKRNHLILVSSGPMAKALTYRLCNKNHWVIDTGHCFDDPLE